MFRYTKRINGDINNNLATPSKTRRETSLLLNDIETNERERESERGNERAREREKERERERKRERKIEKGIEQESEIY